MVRVIRTAGDLATLLSLGARREIHRVTLDLALDSENERRLEATINGSLRSCGCQTGAAFVAVALAAGLVAVLLEPSRIRWPEFGEVWRATVFLVALALVGKIVGLIIAEYRLRHAVREVRLLFEETSPFLESR
jgi:hypothetical protein